MASVTAGSIFFDVNIRPSGAFYVPTLRVFNKGVLIKVKPNKNAVRVRLKGDTLGGAQDATVTIHFSSFVTSLK